MKRRLNFSFELNLLHLSLHLPTGNGGFAIVAGFELQGDRAGANVGNCNVGRRTRELCEEVETELDKEKKTYTAIY